MNIEDFRTYCLSKPGVTEELPFDSITLVFKVAGKIFAITSLETFESINLKCDPEEAVLLREQYSSVVPGYHMNKMHWNSILIDGSITDKQIKQWTDDSYDLVVQKLPKSVKMNILKK